MKHSILSIFGALFVLIVPCLVQPAEVRGDTGPENIRLALVDIVPKTDAQPGDAESFTLLLRLKLEEYDNCTVLEIPRNYQGCSDPECAQKIGMELEADCIVYGALDKVGNIWAVSLQVAGMESGKVDAGITDSFFDEKQAGESVERISRRIVSLYKKEPAGKASPGFHHRLKADFFLEPGLFVGFPASGLSLGLFPFLSFEVGFLYGVYGSVGFFGGALFTPVGLRIGPFDFYTGLGAGGGIMFIPTGGIYARIPVGVEYELDEHWRIGAEITGGFVTDFNGILPLGALFVRVHYRF